MYHNNNSIIVFGVNGTSADRYNISMLKWRYVAVLGRLPTSCAVKGCNGRYEATAHVMLDDGRRSDNWFLVPQCSYHNNHLRNGERVALRKNAALISVAQVRAVPDDVARRVPNNFIFN